MNNKKIKWYKSLIVKVNWSIIIIIIIFISILSLSINQLASREISEKVREVNLEIAKSLETNIDNFLDDKEKMIHFTSPFIKKILVNNKDVENKIRGLLSGIKKEYSSLEYIYFVDAAGNFIIHPQVNLKADYNPKERIWYKNAIENNDLTWTDVYLDGNEKFLMITVAMPIKNDQGEVLGVIAGDILLDELSRVISNKRIRKTGYAYIANQNGEIIAHPDYNLIENKYNINNIMNYDKIYGEKIGYTKYMDNNEAKLASFIHLERLNSMVFIQTKESEIFTVVNKLEYLVFIISLVILVILIVTVYLINKRYLLNPIRKLINFVTQVAAGNYNVRIKDISDDEIGILAQNFNYMTKEISATYQQLEAYNQEISKLNGSLKYKANHDPLTGIANKRKFMNYSKLILNKEEKGAIILLDFDNFKEVNDTVGHIYGDKLLIGFAQKLSDFSNDNVFVARYGGDEFLILLRKVSSKSEIINYIYKLKEIADKPFIIDEIEFNINFSIGISCFPKNSKEIYELITMADTAMYRAKEKHNKDYLFYTSKMFDEIENFKNIREIIRNTIENDGFELKYQPQVNTKSKEIESLEALIRLKNYNISPGKFIPIAEKSGLIIDIGRWVTERAIKDLANLNNQKKYSVKISINFSVYQLNDLDYIRFLAKKLAENNVKAENLEIEITESLFIRQQEKAINYLKQLNELGVKLALDDFGTGYSSLSYLTYLSFDKVKVDKILIDKFLDSNNLQTMESLISFFHSINLPVVAEGVEVNEQLKKLDSVSCDYIQGYLFSKPVLFSEIDNLFKNNFNN